MKKVIFYRLKTDALYEPKNQGRLIDPLRLLSDRYIAGLLSHLHID